MKRLVALTLIAVSLAACASATPTLTPTGSPPATPTATLRPSPTATPAPTATPTATPLPPIALHDRWVYPTADNWHETEAFWTLDVADLDGDGVSEILAGSHDRYFYAFAADGTVRWRFRAEAVIYAALVVAEADGSPRVLIGDDSDRVYLLDAEGSLVWQTRLDGRVTHLASLGGAVLAATWKGTLAALDRTGRAQWTTQLPAAPVSLAIGRIGGADVLVGLDSGHVLGIAADGRIVWDRPAGDQRVAARPSALDGIAWVSGDQAGALGAWGADGTRLWEVALGGGMPVWTEAELPGGPALVVGTGDPANRVLALSPDGKTRWESAVAGGVWDLAAADVDGDGVAEILAATEGGTVTVLSGAGQMRGVWYAPSRVAGLRVAALQTGGEPQVVLHEGRFVHVLAPVVNGIPSPIPTPGPPTLAAWEGALPAEDGAVLLAAVGDVMLARTVGEYADRYGVDYPFAPVSAALKQADIAVANLECPIALGGDPWPKTYVFRAHPSAALGLGRSGLNTLSLANNHTLDFGVAGMEETIGHLTAQGLAVVGAGANRTEAERPLVYNVHGVRVALVAWVSYFRAAEFAAGDDRPGVAYLDDLERMARQIEAAKQQADVVVVILHGGREYDPAPTAAQQTAARRAVDAGADLVVGHHPHVLQPTEVYKGKLIAYSLGDFVFDIDNYDAARDGAILWAWIGKDGVRRAELWRTRIVHDAHVRFRAGADGQVQREVLLPAGGTP
ncbi:MAG: CapA family protein [Anaerolineae bacterium]|nr:CapA family protein [Anaerolineae bacterium]